MASSHGQRLPSGKGDEAGVGIHQRVDAQDGRRRQHQHRPLADAAPQIRQGVRQPVHRRPSAPRHPELDADEEEKGRNGQGDEVWTHGTPEDVSLPLANT